MIREELDNRDYTFTDSHFIGSVTLRNTIVANGSTIMLMDENRLLSANQINRPMRPTDSPSRWHKHKKTIIVCIASVIVVGVVAGSYVYYKQTGHPPGQREAKTSTAEQEGKNYSNGKCSGNEVKKLTHLPLDAENITNVLPYGGVVGAHIMPISHAYIWPGKQGDPRDKYNVYAMADSTLYSISSRSINVDSNRPKQAEYQLGFSVSCVEFYYYDLMTSLTPELQKALDSHPAQDPRGNSVGVNIPVKAGQLLGKIGSQTLDYAVWDFNKTLTGYVVPEHYDGDKPRTHLVSPFDYVTDDVRQALLSKLVRSVEPLAGKVDYDIDGKLIGGWFQDGTGGYSGTSGNNGSFRYWAGHLAIVPDDIDPTMMLISTGTYISDKEAQFAIAPEANDPKTVGVDTGLVKYDLFQIDHIKADGSPWNRFDPSPGLKGKPSGQSSGCALFQLVETRKLKVEFTPGKVCASTLGFSAAFKTYGR